MPGKSDIKAGSAYVELLLKDSAFVKGLKASSTKLKNFGSGVAGIGAGIAAAGSSIVAPIGGRQALCGRGQRAQRHERSHRHLGRGSVRAGLCRK